MAEDKMLRILEGVSMKFKGKLAAMAIIFALAVPTTVLAAGGHEHSYDPNPSESTSISSSDQYCKIITYTTIQQCIYCPYKLVTTNVEYIPHQWELVCVDPSRNGYQKTCALCHGTSGSVIYPNSVTDPEVEY